jgi:hypothetical protein
MKKLKALYDNMDEAEKARLIEYLKNEDDTER